MTKFLKNTVTFISLLSGLHMSLSAMDRTVSNNIIRDLKLHIPLSVTIYEKSSGHDVTIQIYEFLHKSGNLYCYDQNKGKLESISSYDLVHKMIESNFKDLRQGESRYINIDKMISKPYEYIETDSYQIFAYDNELGCRSLGKHQTTWYTQEYIEKRKKEAIKEASIAYRIKQGLKNVHGAIASGIWRLGLGILGAGHALHSVMD